VEPLGAGKVTPHIHTRKAERKGRANKSGKAGRKSRKRA
jgi:hypothetical protein